VVGPLSRSSVADLIVAELRDAILSGRYAPGERLPTQRKLAAELSVNISSIREALSRLEQLRLVEVRHGDATRVLDWRASGGLEALALLGSLELDVIAPLFEARRLLLVEAARLAASRRSPEQADQLHELASGVLAADDDEAALLLDWTFMTTIIEAADNLVFRLIMNSVRELYLPNAGAFRGVVTGWRTLAPLYAAIAQAIDAGDADLAAAKMHSLAAIQEQQMTA